jgi:hypothetical protein
MSVDASALPLESEDEERAERILLVTGVAALGGFLFGFDTAVINGAVGAIEREFDASSFAIGLSVSSALLGSASVPGSPVVSPTASGAFAPCVSPPCCSWPARSVPHSRPG